MFTIGTVTGTEIWEHVARDVDVMCQPPSVQAAIKPFIMARNFERSFESKGNSRKCYAG